MLLLRKLKINDLKLYKFPLKRKKKFLKWEAALSVVNWVKYSHNCQLSHQYWIITWHRVVGLSSLHGQRLGLITLGPCFYTGTVRTCSQAHVCTHTHTPWLTDLLWAPFLPCKLCILKRAGCGWGRHMGLFWVLGCASQEPSCGFWFWHRDFPCSSDYPSWNLPASTLSVYIMLRLFSWDIGSGTWLAWNSLCSM